MSIDHDDIQQAIEIACGDKLGGAELGNRRTASAFDTERLTRLLRRVLGELPPDVTVQELIEAMDD